MVVLLLANLLVVWAAAGSAEAFAGRRDLQVDEPVAVTPVEPAGAGFVDPSADQVWDKAALADRLPEPFLIPDVQAVYFRLADLEALDETKCGALNQTPSRSMRGQ